MKLERALHHPFPYRRIEGADFAPIVRIPPPPVWEWLCIYDAPSFFVPQLSSKTPRLAPQWPRRSPPSTPEPPSFLLAISYAARRVSTLQTWDV